MPRGIGSSGIGACTMVSHLRHEQAGRTWRSTSKCAGYVAQHLGDGLAHLAQLGPAAGLAHAGRHVHDVAAWKLGRQLAALLLLGLHVLGRLCLGVRRFRLGLLRLRCNRLGLRRLRFLQRQLELFESPLDPLRARTELTPTELGDLGLQLLDRQLRDDEAVLRRCQLAVLAVSSASLAISSALSAAMSSGS